MTGNTMLRPALFGLAAAVLLLTVYVGVVSLGSGWKFMLTPSWEGKAAVPLGRTRSICVSHGCLFDPTGTQHRVGAVTGRVSVHPRALRIGNAAVDDSNFNAIVFSKELT